MGTRKDVFAAIRCRCQLIVQETCPVEQTEPKASPKAFKESVVLLAVDGADLVGYSSQQIVSVAFHEAIANFLIASTRSAKGRCGSSKTD